jgi:nicotinamide-nucleotide amidase
MDEAVKVIATLTERGKTLVTAESCTGGLLGSLLTDVPGASKAYLGGVISYAYALKEACLGVEHALLENKGAVCPEVAVQMAWGARQRLQGDYALAVTGNAGPGTDPSNPNVGEIYIAYAGKDSCSVQQLSLSGTREENRMTACRAVLNLLLQNL